MPADNNRIEQVESESPQLPTGSTQLNLVELSQTLLRDERNFKNEQAEQGFLGKSYDWMKNNLGGSVGSESTFGSIWSHVLSSDDGSEAVKGKIETAKEEVAYAASSATNSGHAPGITLNAGRDTDKAVKSVSDYEKSQRYGVELLADGVAVGAVLAARKPTALLDTVLIGAGAKSVAKYADGKYSDLGDDLITGGMMGASLSIGRTSGIASSTAIDMVGTIVGARARGAAAQTAFRYGVEGATVGYLQNSAQRFNDLRVAGADRSTAASQMFSGHLMSKSVIAGALLGSVGGRVVGRMAESLHKS